MKNIANFMTPCPFTVSAQASLEDAICQMELRKLRHIPVVSEGELVGVLTHKDAQLCELLCTTIPFCPKVGDVCQKDPFIVAADARVSHVAYEMAERKLDYVLVADEEEHVTGIFTTTDACRYIHYLTSDH